MRKLDWLAEDPFASTELQGDASQYNWQMEERQLLTQDLVLLAADVVYDEQLTMGMRIVLLGKLLSFFSFLCRSAA